MLTTVPGYWRHRLVLLALPLLLMGCFGGNKSTSAPDTGVLAKVDTMFGEVTINKPKAGELRVVALGWSDAEAALAMGVKPVAVLDWMSFGQENKGVGPWAAGLFGDFTPTVIPRPAADLNYEQIQALNPDVILNVRSDNSDKAYERLKQIAPTVYAPKDTKPWLIDWRVQQKQVAAALGIPEKADAAIATAQKAIDDGNDPAYRGVNTVTLVKYSGGTYIPFALMDFMTALGFTQDPRVSQLPAQDYYANVPAEKIPLLDTGVLVLLLYGFTEEEARKDPLISSLQAAKDDRVVYADQALSNLFGAGSVLSIPETIKQLKDRLHAAASKAHSAH